MIRFLFPRLTPPAPRGEPLFKSLVVETRQPHWYLVGRVPDTIDGRFALLATITALASVRLEHGGEIAQDAAVGLTERFVEAMDSEHREMGIGDPTLGKKVRQLVGSLGRRIALWRDLLRDDGNWNQAAAESLFRGGPPSPEAADHCGQHLRLLWTRLAGLSDQAVAEGRIR